MPPPFGSSLPYDRLTLTSADDGERLELVSQVPLEGSTWTLEWSPERVPDGARVTLRMEDGAATGEGPCGPYTAEYATDGVFITFRDAQGARDDTCAALRAEKALLDGLRTAVTVERREDQLRLVDARAVKTLVFRPPFAP